jgi:hypothetical protein
LSESHGTGSPVSSVRRRSLSHLQSVDHQRSGQGECAFFSAGIAPQPPPGHSKRPARQRRPSIPAALASFVPHTRCASRLMQLLGRPAHTLLAARYLMATNATRNIPASSHDGTRLILLGIRPYSILGFWQMLRSMSAWIPNSDEPEHFLPARLRPVTLCLKHLARTERDMASTWIGAPTSGLLVDRSLPI